jgi:endonuclease/exonuclease/phosphatase family metal-dependent hydrolase
MPTTGHITPEDVPPRWYGPLVETTMRVITWNVWGLYGAWQEREAAITATLAGARPDIVVLTESWAQGGDSQCARLAHPLGLLHHAFSGVAAQEDQMALSGVGVLSRWPIERESSLTFGDARVQFVTLAGPRGPVQVYGLVMDAWWFDQSQARQQAVRELLTCISREQNQHTPLIVCGDFNTDPDSDEIRMLTGRTTAPVPGLSFYDAWEAAGPPAPGHTWSNDNPQATQLLWPNRRIDYIFSATWRRGGAGHPRQSALLGTDPVRGTYASDHYGLQADLRY